MDRYPLSKSPAGALFEKATITHCIGTRECSIPKNKTQFSHRIGPTNVWYPFFIPSCAVVFWEGVPVGTILVRPTNVES